MAPHVHVGLIEFLIIGLNVLIFSFLWRLAAHHFIDTPLGRAMAAVYS
jgi:hypothetical protein